MVPKEIARIYDEDLEDVGVVVRYAKSVMHEYMDYAEDEFNLTALAEDCESNSGIVVDEEVYYEVAFYVAYE